MWWCVVWPCRGWWYWSIQFMAPAYEYKSPPKHLGMMKLYDFFPTFQLISSHVRYYPMNLLMRRIQLPCRDTIEPSILRVGHKLGGIRSLAPYFIPSMMIIIIIIVICSCYCQSFGALVRTKSTCMTIRSKKKKLPYQVSLSRQTTRQTTVKTNDV